MSFKQPFHFRSAAIVLSLAAMTALPGLAQGGAQQAVSKSATPDPQLFSSSALPAQDDATELPSLAAHFGPNANASPQYGGGYGGPGPRRPYGRPTYKDRWSNSDGSSKFAFEAGVGPVTAAGSTGHYSRTGVGFSLGVGRNFSRAFGVLLQYNYDHMGMPSSTVNNFILTECAGSTSCASNFNGTGATHLWSLTVNPVISFSNPHSQWGMYVVGGGGFYRKVSTFNITDAFGDTQNCNPSVATGCHFSNNAIGVNAGLGFTYKLTQDSNAKVFGEARYVWVDNQASVNNTTANGGFPQTNQRTGYFPVTLGLRF
jgi:hypothetical protein